MPFIRRELARGLRHQESFLLAVGDESWKVFAMAPLTPFTASDIMTQRVRKKGHGLECHHMNNPTRVFVLKKNQIILESLFSNLRHAPCT